MKSWTVLIITTYLKACDGYVLDLDPFAKILKQQVL